MSSAVPETTPNCPTRWRPPAPGATRRQRCAMPPWMILGLVQRNRQFSTTRRGMRRRVALALVIASVGRVTLHNCDNAIRHAGVKEEAATRPSPRSPASGVAVPGGRALLLLLAPRAACSLPAGGVSSDPRNLQKGCRSEATVPCPAAGAMARGLWRRRGSHDANAPAFLLLGVDGSGVLHPRTARSLARSGDGLPVQRPPSHRECRDLEARRWVTGGLLVCRPRR